jgi:hypothetical protein
LEYLLPHLLQLDDLVEDDEVVVDEDQVVQKIYVQTEILQVVNTMVNVEKHLSNRQKRKK